MLTIVVGYKTKNRRKETPEVLYLGHSRREATAVTVPEGFLFIETQHVAPGFRRRWSKEAKAAAKAAASEAKDSDSITPPEQAAGEAGESDKAPAVDPEKAGDDNPSDSKESPADTTAPGNDPAAEGVDSNESAPPASGDQPELPAADAKASAAKQAAKKAATKQGKSK